MGKFLVLEESLVIGSSLESMRIAPLSVLAELQKRSGGGIMIDMFCHWQCHLKPFGPIDRLVAHGNTALANAVMKIKTLPMQR